MALQTDPYRSRAVLHALDQLPVLPRKETPELQRLKTVLEEEYERFEVPKNHYEHAVSAAKALWPLLLEPESYTLKGRLREPIWLFNASDGLDIEGTLCWMSLVESFAHRGRYPWAYLYALFEQLAEAGEIEPKAWTPGAWMARTPCFRRHLFC